MQDRKLILYTTIINILGVLIIAVSLNHVLFMQQLTMIAFFSCLSIISESLIIPIGENSYVSIGFAIGLAAIMLFDPYFAALVMTIGTLFKVYREDDTLKHIGNTSFYKNFFNAAAYSISAFISGMVYQHFGNVFAKVSILGYSIPGILMTILVYVTVNLLIYVSLFTLLENKRFVSVLISQIWYIRNFFGISPLGILMVIAYESYGWFSVLILFGPLLVARYSFSLYMDMKKMYFDTIQTLSKALDAKDEYTNGHSQRVAQYSVQIAERMGLSPKQLETTKTAALLHDIGKIGIKDEVLNKNGKLDFKEYYEIQQHPEIGANIIKDVASLRKVSEIIRHHHERYDGNGYPDSVLGTSIPIESSIIAVADAYDAMTSDRSYRKAMSHGAAMEIIRSGAGSQFHPDVVKHFVTLENEIITEVEHAG